VLTPKASDRVHVRLFKLQLQPEPPIDVAFKPVLSVFVTVTVPEEGIFPKLTTDKVSVVLVCPWTRKNGPDIWTVISTSGLATGVTSFNVLFAVFESPVSDTVIVFVTEEGALAAMFTASVITG